MCFYSVEDMQMDFANCIHYLCLIHHTNACVFFYHRLLLWDNTRTCRSRHDIRSLTHIRSRGHLDSLKANKHAFVEYSPTLIVHGVTLYVSPFLLAPPIIHIQPPSSPSLSIIPPPSPHLPFHLPPPPLHSSFPQHPEAQLFISAFVNLLRHPSCEGLNGRFSSQPVPEGICLRDRKLRRLKGIVYLARCKVFSSGNLEKATSPPPLLLLLNFWKVAGKGGRGEGERCVYYTWLVSEEQQLGRRIDFFLNNFLYNKLLVFSCFNYQFLIHQFPYLIILFKYFHLNPQKQKTDQYDKKKG